MDTFAEAEKLIQQAEVQPEVQPAVAQPLDLHSIIKHIENGAGALRVESEKLMSKTDKYHAEVKKEMDIQAGKVEVTLQKLENFCNNELPKIIKKNVEGNYYSQSKEIVTDVQNQLTESLNKSFAGFGKALTEFEIQAQRSADLVSNKSKQPLHLSVLHGAKWLAISIAFTFLFLKVNTHLDKKSIDYGYKAKSVINTLPPAEAKRINLVIDQIK